MQTATVTTGDVRESPVLPLVREDLCRRLEPDMLAAAEELARRFSPHADAQRVFLGLTPEALAAGKAIGRYAELLLPFAASSCFEDLARAFARLPEDDLRALQPVVQRYAETAPLVAGGLADLYYPGILAHADAMLAVAARSQWIASELPFACRELQGHEPAVLALANAWLPLGDWACLEGLGYIIDATRGKTAAERTAFLDALIQAARADPRAAVRAARDAIPQADQEAIYERQTLPALREPPRPAGSNPVSLLASTDELGEFEEDPRGHFVLTLLNGLIRCKYYRRDRLAVVIEGRIAEEILKTVCRLKLVSNQSHAAWLGSELMRAEIAVRRNLPYLQERMP